MAQAALAVRFLQSWLNLQRICGLQNRIAKWLRYSNNTIGISPVLLKAGAPFRRDSARGPNHPLVWLHAPGRGTR